MAKSRKNKRSILSSISKTSKKALPALNKGLIRVGSVTKNVAVKTLPVMEKGVSAVYGTMATGFDLGIKGAKSITKSSTKKRHRKGGKKSRKH